MAGAILQLDRDTRPPSEPATWDALVDWASRLRQEYVRADDASPATELTALPAVDEVIESLRKRRSSQRLRTGSDVRELVYDASAPARGSGPTAQERQAHKRITRHIRTGGTSW
jgi:hypothetical protein